MKVRRTVLDLIRATRAGMPLVSGMRRLALPLSVLLLTGAADPPPSAAWNLTRLMASMREVRSSTATFSEQKFVAMLRQPLVSSGRLIYVAPDQLRKETVAPAPSRLTVTGDRVSVVQTDGQTKELSLAEYPEIGALVESIRATLAGDAANLNRYYTVALGGGPKDWTLVLEPREDRLRKLLAWISIQGGGTAITRIETVERDGDRTVTTVLPDAR
jgi:hypothetical protein